MRKIISKHVVLIFAVLMLLVGFHSPKTGDSTQDVNKASFSTNLISNYNNDAVEKTTRETMVYEYRYYMIGGGIILILATLWIATLNYLVKTKTRALYKANEQLSQTQSQNKAIINAIPDVIFLIDNDTRIKEYKAEGSETPFLQRTDMMGRKLTEFLPGFYGELLSAAVPSMANINELKTLEFEMTVQNIHKYYELRIMRSGKNEVIALLRDMTNHFSNLENIKFLSYHDQLTGLFNRYMFDEELNRLDVVRNFPLSIVMADVNGLKLINDCFGHPVGDQLLKQFAMVLKKVFREDDIICRVGGDEFVVILPQTTFEVTNQLIKRIQSYCDEVSVFNLVLSVALGSATKHNVNDSIKDVLKYAEDKMYRHKLFESPLIKEQMINRLLESLFEANASEETHANVVEKNAVLLGEAIGLNSTEIQSLRIAGKYHDIGKIAIQQDILKKAGPLEGEEFEHLKTHPDIGFRILSAANEMSDCANIILAHHERWDGLGYPKGLVGDEIQLLSRILAIADAFAAMTQDSNYKETMSYQEALLEVERCSGTQFDPILAKKFTTIFNETNITS